ncbi:MAG: alanine racemase C-terminal domain-containing protein [Nitrospiraceae bacterium]
MLYGYHTLPALPSGVTLRPVLSWQTTVAHLRTVEAGASVSYNRTFVATRKPIAVLPVGYADGHNRLLSNRGRVLVRGRRASVVGRVCMDMTMIDVTDCPGAAIGDPVVLIGRQSRRASRLRKWPVGCKRSPTRCFAPSAPGSRVSINRPIPLPLSDRTNRNLHCGFVGSLL